MKGHTKKCAKQLYLFKTGPHGAQATYGAHYIVDEDLLILLSHVPKADIVDMYHYAQLGKQHFY